MRKNKLINNIDKLIDNFDKLEPIPTQIKMEIESGTTEASEGPKPSSWYSHLTTRLKTIIAFKNLTKKTFATDKLQHLFSAPIHKDNEHQDLTLIKKSNIPTLWILGGPGAPIQAFVDRVAKVYKFHHVFVGKILKEEILAATGGQEMVHKLMHRGVVLPRKFLNEMIIRDMADAIENKSARGFLFSDYPTTFDQAKAFIKKVQEVDFVLVLKFEESTMKLNAFHVLRRQSLSSKRLSKTKEELRKAAGDQVNKYLAELTRLEKLCGNKMRVIDGHLEMGVAYKEIMKWIERAMVIRNMMPPFVPHPPVRPRRFGSGGTLSSFYSNSSIDLL